ncbi:MAG: hypothetical protein ACN4GG_11060 [Akkermansiaceae bacterium]
MAAFSVVFLLILRVILKKKSKHGAAAMEAVDRHASGALVECCNDIGWNIIRCRNPIRALESAVSSNRKIPMNSDADPRRRALRISMVGVYELEDDDRSMITIPTPRKRSVPPHPTTLCPRSMGSLKLLP